MIHLHRSTDNQFYFIVRAKNGRVLVTSETYKEKRSAISGIVSLRKHFNQYVPPLEGISYKDHTKTK